MLGIETEQVLLLPRVVIKDGISQVGLRKDGI